jgi:hypothetical protein
MQLVMIPAKPRSLPPIVRTTIRTRAVVSSVASWSICGASPLFGCPPRAARIRLTVLAPEQARLTCWATSIAAFVTSAESERMQVEAVLPYTREASCRQMAPDPWQLYAARSVPQ